MKNFLQTVLALFFTNVFFGQTVQDLALNTNYVVNPYSMVQVGNYIYYTNASPSGSNAVYKFDYTSSNPTPIQVNPGTSGFSFLTGIAYHNGFLYVAANNCIWKIDLAQTNPVPQVYYYNDTGTTTYRTKNVFSLCVVGNDLYFHGTVTTPSLLSKIYKVDLTQPTPSPVLVLDNITHRIGSLVNVGNTMYMTTLASGNGVAVRKFDITNPAAGITNVINENGYFCKMTYYKNRLYYPNETTSEVKSFDPFAATATPVLEFNVSRVDGLLGVDCDLYAGTSTTNTTNRMVKVRLPYVTGNAIQSFDFTVPSDVTIEDLVVAGSNITWYTSLADANANTNPMAPNTQLTIGNTYYAVSTDGVCRSLPFGVTVAMLGVEDFLKSKIKLYPNPTQEAISIDFDTNYANVEVKVLNTIGQELKEERFKEVSKISFQMPEANGIYFVKVKTEEGSVSYKVIKE